jgi:hypothetical protein
MKRNNKIWLALAVFVLLATSLACGTTTTGGSNSSSNGPMSGLVGKWKDPDTTGTITTIAWQNNEYVVVSVINPDRGGNEVTESKWANNVLTWTYCPPQMYCITSDSVSVSGDTLNANWTSEHGDTGTTAFSRVP